TSIDISIGDEQGGIWSVIQNPSLIGPEELQEIQERKIKEETWLNNTHKEAREKMQGLQGKPPIKTSTQFLKRLYSNVDFIKRSFGQLMERCNTTNKSFRGHEHIVIRNLEPWLFYFSAIGINIFDRSVKIKKYGKKKHPGGIDVQQAIYLSFSDYFITNDPGQYRTLRIISLLGHRKRQIIHYRNFAEKILSN
ncbi:hypothetical protein ACFL31_01895, partial [Candidatus Margulisiibacteriota bacterium]